MIDSIRENDSEANDGEANNGEVNDGSTDYGSHNDAIDDTHHAISNFGTAQSDGLNHDGLYRDDLNGDNLRYHAPQKSGLQRIAPQQDSSQQVIPQNAVLGQRVNLEHRNSSDERVQRILNGLDDNQRTAALALSGPVRIVAGAGSGKTRTITRRIAYACASKEWNPDATLAVTYTNKAANEMKNRLATLGVYDVHTSTFHSAAYSQLRRAWRILAHQDSPEISSDMDVYAHAALTHVLQYSDYTDAEVRDIIQEISWMKVNLIAYEDYERIVNAIKHPLPLDLEPEQMMKIARDFEAEKRLHNVIDFDDSLLLLSHIYELYPELAEDFRQKMRHITIDEYQDVSALQHRVLTQWLGRNRDICVVGDPAQTIYSYAGASSYYLMNFAQEFAPVSLDIELNHDYRSSGHIVDYANAVLENSVNSAEYIHLETDNDAGPQVHIAKFGHDDEEFAGIASRIHWHIQRGTKINDIAILTRTRARARDIARICRGQGLTVNLKLDNDSVVLSGEKDEDSLTISTIHASKGLEWDMVFIPDCFEGNIPFNPNIATDLSSERDEEGMEYQEHIEEERRIFYVALTRGIRQVYLCLADRAFENGYGSARTVSRFVREAHNAVRRAKRHSA
ncbi:ATP-dependent helicase [Alloscardovia theropitheci]|uniref:DNA 3'-5' helicase n=1 Tax=Alloscardovia theropitheci TaxID=2496842 RepID=A0A4R0QQW3_9BIFI|nr:ATP-dependent helicase [Alloscardovia theropitheci]TCD54723.1 ATP-dependent helicase [Alloscardovia theropitheci]